MARTVEQQRDIFICNMDIAAKFGDDFSIPTDENNPDHQNFVKILKEEGKSIAGTWVVGVKPINLNDKSELRRKFEHYYNEWKNGKDFTDISKFIEKEITWAKNWQSKLDIHDNDQNIAYAKLDKWIRFCESMENYNSEFNPRDDSQIKNKLNAHFSPKPFSELFKNPVLVDSCIALLKEIDKPCIDDNNQYIRTKGVFAVWLDALLCKGMLNCHFGSDIQKAAILNHNFRSLNIAASTCRSPNSRARVYKDDFEREIAAIKAKQI